MICPKCKYVRKESDAAPAWQCPNCGIAVEKYAQLMQQDDLQLREEALEHKARDQADHKIKMTYVILFAIGLFGLLAGERWGLAYVLVWFLIALWAGYCMVLMLTTGYYSGFPYITKHRVDNPFEFWMAFVLLLIVMLFGVVMGLGTILY